MARRLVLIVSLAVLGLTSVPGLASATFIPGPAGKLVFTSGRPSTGVPAPNTGDKGARLYVVDYPSGTPVQVTTLPAGAEVRHRQPNWSPDHTRIVYAAGASAGTSYALWILDLRTNSQTEFVPAAEGLDRPSWSPDGTEIAYGSEGDLWVKGVAGGSATRVTDNAGTTEERPVWSPDGNTLYYNRGVPPFATGSKRDLYKISPVAASSTETPITSGEDNDWQPALSPDGKTLCFLRGPMGSEADIWLVGVNGGLATPFATSSAGNINCVWSPDGSNIVYTLGVFTAGDLTRRDTNGVFDPLPSSWSVDEHFDGNTDWATNFSPECDPKSADIPVNGFTTVSLSCTDPDFGLGKAPPTPTLLTDDSDYEIVSNPPHGTLGGLSDDAKVVYTPNKDFKGTDTFTYTGSDTVSDAAPATATIRVGLETGKDKTAAKISNIKVSVKRWRLGKKLAKISRAPVGTTISFKLSEAAKASLTFQRVKPRPGGGKRYVKAGTLGGLSAKAGQNKVRFQGRLSRSKSLKPGSYRVVVGATDAAGNKSQPKNGPTFTIVNE